MKWTQDISSRRILRVFFKSFREKRIFLRNKQGGASLIKSKPFRSRYNNDMSEWLFLYFQAFTAKQIVEIFNMFFHEFELICSRAMAGVIYSLKTIKLFCGFNQIVVKREFRKVKTSN